MRTLRRHEAERLSQFEDVLHSFLRCRSHWPELQHFWLEKSRRFFGWSRTGNSFGDSLGNRRHRSEDHMDDQCGRAVPDSQRHESSPLLPLDGGRVVPELFFARHYAFDVGFRVLTACIAATLAVIFGDWFFGFLGFLTAIGIPTALRSGRIVHVLRKEGIQCDSKTDDIPQKLAVRILDEVNRTFPAQGLTPKLKAQTTLGIFESLNSHAPGIGTTLALSWIHAASFIGAFVTIIVLMIGQQKLTNPDSGPGLPSEPESAERP